MGLVSKEPSQMKTLVLVALAAATLAGCAVVPAYGPPGYYAPTVVVPFGGYYGHRGHRHYR
jgi:ABC-type uncharacterized transport system auxiliary subunit